MILVLDHASGFGGGQTVLMQIAEHLRNADVAYEILLPRGGHRYDELQVQHLGIRALPMNHKNRLLDILRLNIGLVLSKTVWRRDAMVYVNGPRLLPFVVLRAMLFRYKQIAVHLHLEPGKFVLSMLKLLKLMQPRTSLICCSEYIREVAARSFPKSDIYLLENALGPRYVAYAENRVSTIRSNYRLEVAIVGGVHLNKGQDVVLDLPDDLVKQLRIHIIGPMIGGDKWVNNLKTNAPENIIFAGPKLDVAQYFEDNRIDISIVPSRWAEPFGLVAIEGMALDTVTLARAVGNFPFIAAKTGMQTFSTDTELFSALRKLIEGGSAKMVSLKHSQRNRTLAHYSHYRIGEILTKIGMLVMPSSTIAENQDAPNLNR